ncbi:Mn2+/Fe2+ NRAMP family transporter [Melghirimyces profundicolus]|uniref:Mn2+/Fe2+ NRAMP family transporter n=1 Tax=Melghirimyces profundicolus TaxID=1242148 RepID=A0A2T6BSW4_9BACL|nr:Mn2+/Fe2+ NRAMP family transporter [Melghirimyces profundicolus]
MGVGDLVAALVAGTMYGNTFVWAILIGALLKYFLNEGIGRWYLASGQTILQGWKQLGRWATGYFGVYVIIWGFVFGAAVTSTTALATTAMFPGIPLWAWAMFHGLLGFLLVWTGRYWLFEKVMLVLVGVMFVTVVGSAVMIAPSLGELSLGLVPRLPEGSLFYALGLIGGVGGTITMASYGYWLREKGWRRPDWMPVMRLDATVAYTMTGIFTLALLVIGAELLFGTGTVLEGDKGLISLSGLLGERLGEPVRWLFLIGFWSASFTSLLGVWNGVPYLFSDFVRTVKKIPMEKAAPYLSEKSRYYRSYLAWLTFPPMLLLFLGKPFALVIAYGVLGALFMPFLAVTLIWLLNSRRVAPEYRNGWVSNIVLGASVILFGVLAVQNVIELLE